MRRWGSLDVWKTDFSSGCLSKSNMTQYLKHSCPNVFIAHVLPIWRAPFSRTGFLSVVSFHALNWLMISLSILINTRNSSFLCMFYTFFLTFLCKSSISYLKSQIIKVENDRKWLLKAQKASKSVFNAKKKGIWPKLHLRLFDNQKRKRPRLVLRRFCASSFSMLGKIIEDLVTLEQ